MAIENKPPVWPSEFDIPSDLSGSAQVPMPDVDPISYLAADPPVPGVHDIEHDNQEFDSMFWPKPRRHSMSELEEINRAEQERRNGPATLEDVRLAVEEARRMERPVALTHIRNTVKRLPDNLKAQTPPIMSDEDVSIIDQWEYLQTHEKTRDMLVIPEFQHLLGPKYKKIGSLEKLWYTAPLGAMWLGMKRGGRNVQYGRHGGRNLFNLGDPQFQAEMYALMAERAEDQAFLEALEANSGFITNLIRDFQVNLGDTAGGMALSGMTPEALAGAVAGAGIGSAVGGIGAIPGALSGWLTGLSIAQASSAGGANAWEDYLAQPDDMKNESLARQTFFMTAVPSFVLERLGSGFMLRGASPFLQGVAGGAARSVAPMAANRMSALLASKSYKGVMARLAANAAWHTVPEIITEGLQEGPVEVGARMISARTYNLAYGGQGYAMVEPTWGEMVDSALAGAWQAFWGGAGIGLVGPGMDALRDLGETTAASIAAKHDPGGRAKPLSEDQKEAVIDYSEDAAAHWLHLATIERGNNELRQQVKETTEIIRQDSELNNNPELMREVLDRFGEKKAYANAEALSSLFQSAVDTAISVDTFQADVLDPLGINPDQFFEALDDGTDVVVDLNGLPEMVNNPLWDQITDLLTVEPAHVTEEVQADLRAMGPPPVILPTADAEVSQQIRSDLEKRLIAAGRKKSWAKREAAVWSRMLGQLAPSLGVKVDALIDNVMFARESEAGPAASGSLNQAAMYRSRAESLNDFITEALESDPTATRPFRHLDNDFGDTVVELGADQVAHIRKDHPKFDEWSRITEVIEKGDQTSVGPNRVTGRESIAYVLDEGESSLVVVASPNIGGTGRRNRVKRTIVLTAFRDKSSAVSKWLANNKAASSQSVEELQLNPRLKETEPSGPQSGLDTIIDGQSKKDKSLFQAEDEIKGRTDTLADGIFRVVFTEAADASTAIHEFQHAYIQMVQDILALSDDQIVDLAARDRLAENLKDLEDWAGVEDGQWNTEAHEKAARAFEQYFMEGKAPVKGLQNIFRQMKELLKKIYHELRNLGEPLSDDVRRVFDRQLATDEELLVESWRGEPAIDPEEMRDADPALYKEYAEASAKADIAREEEIIAFRNAEHERLVKQWKREGRQAANEDPRRIRLKEIKMSGGIKRSSLEAIGLAPATIETIRKKGMGVVSYDGKVGIDEFAERYGFEYADDFVRELAGTPTIEELISAYVAEQEAYFESYFDSESIITDAEMDKWEMERNLWARFMGEPGSKYRNRSWRDIKNIIDRKTGVKPVDEIAAQNMADLKASLKAQMRAAKDILRSGEEAGKAKGYKRGAAEGYYAGRNQARAEALTQRLELAAKLKSLAERQREIEKALAQFKQISKQNTAKQFKHGGILPSYHSQIKAMLHQFGIGPEVQTEMSLADFITQEKELNAGIGVADWIVNGDWPVYASGRRTGERIPLRSLPYSQFNDLKQAVANLTFLGRRQQKVMVDGQLQDLNQVVENLVVSAAAEVAVKAPRTEQEIFEDTGDKSKIGGALLDFFKGFMPALLKIETICRVLDGGKYGGTWQKILYEAVNNAYHNTLIRTEKLTADVSAIIDSLVGKSEMMKWRGDKIVIEGVPWTFTQEQLFMYIMHLGNPQNTQLARNFDFNDDGKGVTDAQHLAIMDAAPKEMWDLAQALWDYQDLQMFPELNALTLRTTGLPLKKVEAQPVMTRHGQYRGGYSPIVFDRRMSKTAERLNAQRDSAQAAASRFRPGKTNAGATNERTGTTYKDLRASLSFDTLANSWAENIYDLSYREATNDLKRLLADPRTRQTISGAFSEQHLQQFDLWIQEQIAPGSERKSTLTEVDAALRIVRRNITTAAMGLKASVALCQPSGLFQAMHKIGLVNTAIGVTSFFGGLLTGGRPFLDQLYQKTPELGYRNTSGGFDRDIKDSMGMRNPLHKTLRDKFDDVAFKVICTFDQLTANSIWTGAYLDALKKGKSEAEAIEYGNSVVRTTQSTGASKDLSYVQRGMGYGDLGKIFTMFGTFFSASHNLFWEQYQLTKNDLRQGNYGRAAKGAGSAVLFMSLLPAIYDAIMRDGLPEDEEDWERMGKGAVSYYVGGIPVVKDLVGRALGTSFRFQPAPILGTLDNMTVGLGSGLKKIAAGEEGGWNQTIRGLGGWTGLPTGQITTTMKGIEEWDDREGFDAFYRLLVRESPK